YTEQLLQIESRQTDIAEVPIPYSPRLQQGGVRVEFSSPQDLYALLLAPAISKDSRLRDALSASIDRGAIENVFLQRHGPATAALDLDAIADQIGMSLSFSKDMTDADLFQAENQLLKSQALIPLAHVSLGTAVSTRVRNWSTTPDGRWHVENLWVEGR